MAYKSLESDSTAAVTRSRISPDGLAWRTVGNSPYMGVEGKCINPSCEYFHEKLDEIADRKGWPKGDISSRVVFKTIPGANFFQEFSRSRVDRRRSFKGDLKKMLDKDTYNSRAWCPGCKRAVGEDGGPEVVTICFRGCQFRLMYCILLDNGKKVTVRIPESEAENNPFINVMPHEVCSLCPQPFRRYDRLQELTVEMNEWPTGLIVPSFCRNADCALNKSKAALDSDRDLLAFHSLGLGVFTVTKSGDSVVILDNRGTKIKPACAACGVPFRSSDVDRVGFMRCMCQVETARKKHPWFISSGYASSADVAYLEVKQLAKSSPPGQPFRVRLTLEPVWRGVTVRGRCTRGFQCPLRDPELELLFGGDEGTYEESCMAYSDVIEPQERSRDKAFTSARVVNRPCKACRDSNQFSPDDDSTIEPQALSVYACAYKMAFRRKSDLRLVRRPERKDYRYVIEGHVLEDLDSLGCKMGTLEVTVEATD